MKARRIGSLLSMTVFSLLMVIIFSGCATGIAFTVVKPAEINMSEYTHLALFDIEPYEFTISDFAGTVFINILLGRKIEQPTGYTLFLERDVADELERQIIYTLQQSNYFTLIPPSQLRPFQTGGKSGAYQSDILMNQFNVTASLIGNIESMRFNEFIEEETVEVDDGIGGKVEELRKTLIQDASIEFSYSILDLRTSRIAATRYLRANRRRTTLIKDEDNFRPPTLFSLYQLMISDFAAQIRNQLVPRTVREYRYLEQAPDKHPDMEYADKLVREGSYNQALRIYLDIWYAEKLFAAGYNASVIYEVLGQLRQAVSFSEEVAAATGNPKAYVKLDQLKRSLEEYNQAVEQMRQ